MYNFSCSESALLFFLFVAIWFPYSMTCFNIIGGNINLNVREHWDYCFLQISLRNMHWDSWNSNIVFPVILSNALTEDSLDMTSFSSLLYFSRNFLFSSCSLLITMSLRFIFSSLRQFIVEIMFSATLASAHCWQLPLSWFVCYIRKS